MSSSLTIKSLLLGAGAMVAASIFVSAVPTPAEAQWRGGHGGGGMAFRGGGFRGGGVGGAAFRGGGFGYRGAPAFRGGGFRAAGFRPAYYGGVRPGWNRAAWGGYRPGWRGGWYGPRWRGGWYGPGWRRGWYGPAYYSGWYRPYYGYGYGYPGYYYDGYWGGGAALATGLIIGAGTAAAVQASQSDYCYRAPRRVLINGAWRTRTVTVCRY